MSERGVFAVDRGIWNDPDFPPEQFSEREAWLWLVSEAAWRETSVRVGSVRIDLQRGQCAFSTRFMAAKWQWSEARVRRFLKRRSDLNQLCTKTDAGATQITICKYDAFQRVGTVGDAASTQERRTSDAKKKQGNIQTPSEPNGSSGNSARAAHLPDFIRPEVEQGFRDFRKRKGDPLTDRAITLISSNLQAIVDRGGDANEALDMCCERGWLTVKPDWYFRSKATGPRLVHANERPPPQPHKRDLMKAIAERGDAPHAQFQDDYRTIDATFHRSR